MATYNGAAYLQAQLDSYLVQERMTDELVVCDDVSTDDTMAILEAFQNNTIVKSIDADEEIAIAKQTAKEYLGKSKNITLRMNMMDLAGIKEKSKEIGIPYQTIISSLVHNYVNGNEKLSYS